MELERLRPTYAKRGITIVSLSYDSAEVVAHFAQRAGIGFMMLADPGSQVIRRIGVLNENYRKDDLRYDGVPWPGTFLLDREGKVTAKFFEEDHHERYTGASLLVKQFGESGQSGEGAHKEYQTPHLRLRTGASNIEAGIGTRITLLLDLDLQPGMHVYAPGAVGYKVVDWTLADSLAWLSHPVNYPNGKLLRVAGEKAMVYVGKQRLTRDFTLGELLQFGAVKDGLIAVEGVLRYQACDSRICYAPREIGLRWSFRFVAHDQIRVPERLQIEILRKSKIR